MSKDCNHRHPDGHMCGLPVLELSPYCQFHHVFRRDLEITDVQKIKLYISESMSQKPGQPVRLSGLVLKGLRFSTAETKGPLWAIFDKTRFDNCFIYNSNFLNASFREAIFNDSVFSAVNFLGKECFFSRARFDCSETVFNGCLFDLKSKHLDNTRVDFTNAEIKTGAHLFSYTIMKTNILAMHELILDARFFKIRIYKESSGLGTVQSLSVSGANDINLSGLDFQGSFFYSHNIDAVNFDPKVLCMDINFSAMRNAQFYRANLEDVWFTRSSLASVWFNDCKWPLKDGYKRLREDEVDEVLGVKNPEALILQYTQLKKNYENARDYIGAGDWFYREMEVRRRRAKYGTNTERRKLHLFVINCYKFISNYGESYNRPLLFLIVILVAFAPFHMLSGFVIDEQLINYRFAYANIFTWQHLTDFANSLVASFSAMTLQGGKIVTFKGLSSNFLYIFQFLITAILVPLFLLALRRKFRR